MLEYFEVHEPQPLPRQSVLVRWCPPQAGFFKTNFDVAIFDGSGLAGIGMAIRDQSGQIIAALSQKIRMPYSVDLAEALACSRVVLFAQGLSLFQVEFEGDSLRIIQAINNQGVNLTLFGHVIEEI